MLYLTASSREGEPHSGFNPAGRGKADLHRNILASYKGSEEKKVLWHLMLSPMKHLAMESHRGTAFGLKGAKTHSTLDQVAAGMAS